MTIFQTILRVLTFRITREEMLQFNRKHFAAGLAGTWLVGIGRYWDDDGATFLQHLGLGSVIYIFLLSLFIWLILKPFFVQGWSYFTVLTYISLTSFPAIFYAIPVEKFYSLDTANSINVWFLAIVALWRLCLLFYFLEVFTKIGTGKIFIVTLMPICLIVATLSILNLERAVFDLMGGTRNRTPNDAAYGVLVTLTMLSYLLIIPLLLGYVFLVIDALVKRKNETRNAKQVADNIPAT